MEYPDAMEYPETVESPYAEDDVPNHLHFDVSHAPSHMLADDGPSQDITLRAALEGAAAMDDEAERFHHQAKEERTLDYFAKLYEQDDKRRAVQLLTRRNEIKLEGSQYLSFYDDEELAWQIESHYLDMQICVGGGLGLAAILPNVTIHHSVEFRLVLGKRFRRFSAKYAKLGFEPTNCMLWIGRSSSGEDSWLAWVPKDSMGPTSEDVAAGSGKEDTTMSEKHYRIAAMFLADMLRRIGHRDIIVNERYPDVMDDDAFYHATNAVLVYFTDVYMQASY
jgi:hypothetical protein